MRRRHSSLGTPTYSSSARMMRTPGYMLLIECRMKCTWLRNRVTTFTPIVTSRRISERSLLVFALLSPAASRSVVRATTVRRSAALDGSPVCATTPWSEKVSPTARCGSVKGCQQRPVAE
eukprot:7389631-Prymnesium_polylepis.2